VLGISKGGSYAVIHVCFDDGSERQCVRPDQSFVIIVLIVLERRWCLFDGREMGEREQEFRLLETGTQMPISITLLTYLSKGNACANTEIRVTATFLNQANESICSGVIPYAMTLSAELQIFNLEIRPLTQQDFLRWRNEPGIRGLQQGKPLKCFNVDRDMERARASSVYLSVACYRHRPGWLFWTRSFGLIRRQSQPIRSCRSIGSSCPLRQDSTVLPAYGGWGSQERSHRGR